MIIVGTAYTTNKPPFNIGGALIKWQQKTDYSHWYMFDGKKYIDSSTIGTKIRDPKDFHKQYSTYNYERWEVDTNMTSEQIIEFVTPMLEIKYAYLQNLGLALMDWFGFEKNPFSNKRKRINCVELVALVLEKDGYGLPHRPDSLDLVDMYKFMEKLERMGKARRVKL